MVILHKRNTMAIQKNKNKLYYRFFNIAANFRADFILPIFLNFDTGNGILVHYSP